MAKIRSGFVSNSSSSSFIVSFPEVPESKEDVKRIMFGDTFDSIGDFLPCTSDKAAEIIFSKIPTAEFHSEESKYETFGRTVSWSEYEDVIVDEYNYPFREQPNGDMEYWKYVQVLLMEEGKKRYEKYIKDHPGTLYEFTFMDDPLEDIQDFCLLKGITVRN